MPYEDQSPGAQEALQSYAEILSDFDEPWCWKLINSPLVKEVPPRSRIKTSNSKFSLFSRTWATEDTVRAFKAFRFENEIKNRLEALVLVSLGSGLDGHNGVAHGGTTAVLFDECLSYAAVMHLKPPFVTGEQKVIYKKPVRTPGLILIRCWADKIEGRKIWIKGTMEDGHGGIYALAETLYIRPRAAL